MVELRRRPLYRQWWFWIIAGLLMFLLGYLIGRLLAGGDRTNPLEDLATSTPETFFEPGPVGGLEHQSFGWTWQS